MKSWVLLLLATAGCSDVLGLRDVDDSPTFPTRNAPDASTADPSDGGDSIVTPVCNAKTDVDSANCGACGHDCLGGTCVASVCQASVAVAEPHPFAVATAGSYLFWATLGGTSATNAFRRLDLTPGASPFDMPGTAATRFVVDSAAKEIFFTGGGHLQAAQAQPNGTVRSLDQASASALDETSISSDGGTLLSVDSTDGLVVASPVGGGAARILSNHAVLPARPRVDGPFGYWLDTGLTTFAQAKLDGTGDVKQLFAQPAGSKTAFAIASSILYWSETETKSGGATFLFRGDPATGSVTPISGAIAGSCESMIVDGGHLWLVWNSGSIFSCPLSGCGAKLEHLSTHASGYPNLRGAALGASFLFTTTDTGILRVARF